MRTLILSLAAAAASGAFAFADDAVMDLSGPRPVVEVWFGESPPVSMIFDTGASGSAILPEYAESLGLPDLGMAAVQSGAGGARLEVQRTELSGRLGPYEFSGAQAVVFDMPLPGNGAPIAGVLSPRAFANGRLLSLNFATGAITLANAGSPPPDSPSSPFEGEQRPLPSIYAMIAGEQRLCHIDTGAPGALTLPWQDRDAFPLAAEPVQSGMARLVNGERPIYSADLVGVVEIGPVILENPEVQLLEGIRGCNIGMEILRQLIVTLDFETGQVWIDPA